MERYSGKILMIIGRCMLSTSCVAASTKRSAAALASLKVKIEQFKSPSAHRLNGCAHVHVPLSAGRTSLRARIFRARFMRTTLFPNRSGHVADSWEARQWPGKDKLSTGKNRFDSRVRGMIP